MASWLYTSGLRCAIIRKKLVCLQCGAHCISLDISKTKSSFHMLGMWHPWECNSVVECSLCMRKAPGSIPGTSSTFVEVFWIMKHVPTVSCRNATLFKCAQFSLHSPLWTRADAEQNDSTHTSVHSYFAGSLHSRLSVQDKLPIFVFSIRNREVKKIKHQNQIRETGQKIKKRSLKLIKKWWMESKNR